MTGLEAIAQKLEEKRQTDLEAILSNSGSQAIARNEYGVTIVNENNIASSLVFKELVKPKYNEVELVKAIDLNIKELRPDIPIANLDLVPKALYDEEVVQNEDLRQQVADLNLEVSSLTTTISDLESEVQSEINNRLSIEQSNDALVNQLNTLTQTVDDFALQIQNSLQKSVEEGILRASLQSQNTGFKAQIQALIKQIDSLNSIIEGLQSQLGAVQNQQAIVQGTQAQAQAAGADVVNEIAIVKIGPDEDTNQPKIWARFKSGGGSQWKNGKSLEVTNNDKSEITVRLTKTNPEGGKDFYTIPQMEFKMAAGENKKVEFTLNENTVSGLDARKKGGWFGGHTGSKDYKGGALKVAIIRSDGTSKDKTYDAGFGKYHPNSY
jgi:predicted  nucleic acid-binding Zn-ribbon protein